MFKKTGLIILILTYAISSRAAFEDRIGVKASGLAGAWTAISDDVSAILWNPAGISQLKNPEINLIYTKPYLGLDYDNLNQGFAGYVQPLGNIGTLGVGYMYFYSDLYREYMATVSYAKDISKDVLSLGITGKLVGLAYVENEYAKLDPLFNQNGYAKTGTSIDVGMLLKLTSDLSIGMVGENINEPNLSLANDTLGKLPLQIRIGSSYKLGDFIPIIDVSYKNKKVNGKEDINIAGGIEWYNSDKTTALRTGVNSREFAIGTSYIFGDGGVDYGFSYPINSISKTFGSHRIGVNWQFGRAEEIKKVEEKITIRPEGPIIFSTEKLSIAIINLVSNNVSDYVSATVSNLLRTELFRSGRFIVLEREKMDAILKEQTLQQTGCTSTECAIEVGRLLNVKIMILGSLDKLGEQYIINIRFIEVEKGEIILAEQQRCSSEGQLPDAVSQLSNKIAVRIAIVGKVLQVKEDKVIINLGAQDNIKIGQELTVSKLGEVVKDAQGRILMQKKEYIATIIVEYVGPEASEARRLRVEKPIEAGDIVEIK